MMANSRIVPVEVMKNFIKNIMIKLNVDPSHAENLADVLVTGDYRGHFSHGLNRIGNYIHYIVLCIYLLKKIFDHHYE